MLAKMMLRTRTHISNLIEQSLHPFVSRSCADRFVAYVGLGSAKPVSFDVNVIGLVECNFSNDRAMC